MRPLSRVAATALLSIAALVAAGRAGAQEADYLACVKVTDVRGLPAGATPVGISEFYGDSVSECEVKKAKMVSLCFKSVNSEANGGNDPRAGEAAADGYGCYKVRCRVGKHDGSVNANDNFGAGFVNVKKLLTLCTPVDLP
jgi:hypothetical protein